MRYDVEGTPRVADRARNHSIAYQPPGDPRSMLLIARRGALEALRDRMTLIMSVLFSVVLPLFLALAVTPATFSMLSGASASQSQESTLAIYLLVVGLLPSASAVGIASGQFAGEREQGNLQPLLVSPASNAAIFGGKVLGAMIPAMFFAAIAEVAYLSGVGVAVGFEALDQVPIAVALAMIGLVPAVTLFAATIASLISSRVRSYNAAQQIGSFVLMPLWGALFVGVSRLLDRGIWALLGAVIALFVVDLLLVRVASATWRREEVLAQR
ncbi:MAG: ABC transporter permease [Chloroflexota bacterium]